MCAQEAAYFPHIYIKAGRLLYNVIIRNKQNFTCLCNQERDTKCVTLTKQKRKPSDIRLHILQSKFSNLNVFPLKSSTSLNKFPFHDLLVLRISLGLTNLEHIVEKSEIKSYATKNYPEFSVSFSFNDTTLVVYGFGGGGGGVTEL